MPLEIDSDEFGYHRPVEPLTHELRMALLEEFGSKQKTTERMYHLLLLIFSNQAVIMDALGELRKEVSEMSSAQQDALTTLTDAITNGEAIEQHAVTLLGTIEQQVADLTAELAAAGTNVDDSAALTALTATVAGGAKALSDAINSVQGAGATTAPPVDVNPPVSTEPVDTPAAPAAPTDGGAAPTTDVPPTQDNSPDVTGTASAPSV